MFFKKKKETKTTIKLPMNVNILANSFTGKNKKQKQEQFALSPCQHRANFIDHVCVPASLPVFLSLPFSLFFSSSLSFLFSVFPFLFSCLLLSCRLFSSSLLFPHSFSLSLSFPSKEVFDKSTF